MGGAIAVSDFIVERRRARLNAIAPSRRLAVLGPECFEGGLDDVEIAFFSGDLYPERSRSFFLPLLEAPRLAWLHSYSAGIDHPIFHRFMDRGVRVTSSSGAAAAPIAQTVLMYLLMLTRNAPAWSRAQQERRWAPHDIRELEGLRLLVCGLGPIGLEVARLAAACGMEVEGLRRAPRGNEGFAVYPLAALDARLGEADAVVLALPSTAATRDLFTAERFARMKPGALFVNVARGDLVDESALVARLESGHLGGAAVDVAREEPLPGNNPLWAAPNLIVTPHASGQSLRSHERAAEAFLDNLERFEDGRPLSNLQGPGKETGS